MSELVRLWLRPKRNGQSVYTLRWIGEDGKEKYESLGHGDKRKAERQRRERGNELRQGYLPSRSMNLKDLLQDYLDRTRAQIETSTAELAASSMNAFIGVVGNRSVSAVRYADCERFQQASIDEGLTPATANMRMAMVGRIFSLAVRRGQLERNPFTGLRKLKVPLKKIRIFGPDEFSRILQHADPPLWRTRVLLAKTAALRRGELLNLTVDDVDFANEVVVVQPKEEGSHRWRWRVKDKDRRELPLVPEVTRLLLDLQVRLPEGQPYLLLRPERYRHIMMLQREGRLTDTIRRCPENNFTRDWQRIFRLAGIKGAEFHDLRRTCITEWLEGGLNIHDVATLAGHGDIKTTQKYYLGLRRSLLDRARAASSALLDADSSARPVRATKTGQFDEPREAVELA